MTRGEANRRAIARSFREGAGPPALSFTGMFKGRGAGPPAPSRSGMITQFRIGGHANMLFQKARVY